MRRRMKMLRIMRWRMSEDDDVEEDDVEPTPAGSAGRGGQPTT